MSYTEAVTIRFDQGDPAGILFYGRLQELSHRVFEAFLAKEVVDRWEGWFKSADFIVPIRRAESVFHRPMYPGRTYHAQLGISKLGESSFEVWTRFFDGSGTDAELCAETRVAHVFADPRRFQKIPIPSALRARLETHLLGE